MNLESFITGVIQKSLGFVTSFFEWLTSAVSGLERGVSTMQIDFLSPTLFQDLATGSLLRLVLLILLLVVAVFAIALKIRLQELEEARKERVENYFIKPTKQEIENKRWGKVELLFRSANPNDWRIAIIEADAMLEDLTLQLGYQGATLGERLRRIESSDFPALSHAWEAHKVRNKIAHEGSRFNLTPQHAWHVYKLYETVFKDARFV